MFSSIKLEILNQKLENFGTIAIFPPISICNTATQIVGAKFPSQVAGNRKMGGKNSEFSQDLYNSELSNCGSNGKIWKSIFHFPRSVRAAKIWKFPNISKSRLVVDRKIWKDLAKKFFKILVDFCGK